MKRLLILVLMVLVTCGLFAQARPSFDQVASGIGKFADGASSTPSISFGSDPDTGLYRYGANEIGFSSNGVYVGRIASGGRLILGATADDGLNRLQLHGNTFINGNLKRFSTEAMERIIELTLANGGTYNLNSAFGGTNANLGKVDIYGAFDAFGEFFAQGSNNAVTLVAGRNAAITDTASSICLYPSGSGIYTIKNNLGSTYRLIIHYHGRL